MKRVRVALALVRRAERWLVARRRPEAHLGGLWEFPGGKIEPSETAPAAAVRELHEECGVSARALECLACRTEDYGDRLVELHPVLCEWVSGEAQPLGSAECRWVDDAELRQLDMPAVNTEIIRQALGVSS